MAKGKVKECDDLWKAKVKERAGGKCEKCGKRAKSIISRVSGFVAEGSEFFTRDAKL